ncbi:crinkler (CRN) family protein, putative [Phytophthora infestans T30-4]|uniref:Crinkler (CRN) family protein, putative n=1 Tax=Phytophthora infestans (strain T30-4) TaxID=403677 RepID=D0N201_PHYIT|nr:crinkler (CRN) family protein, putative [Phytophthora infestans T30-4]EEY68330.1 crinkler (CRN) family protein, putative [Phytophthora infestans T30-4]|eukprot:XP_002905489.1 crinkler (CRN) family protein, putative [Phytophthora infestans T30-4]
MVARKWFLLVGGNGKDLTSTTSVGVDVEDVDTLRDAVKEKFRDSHLAGIAASDLTVFANRAEYDAKRSVLLPQSGSPVTAYGNNEENALIVQVPTQRQVVVPTESQKSFVWKEPKSLVATTGANWDFQNSLDLGNLASAIGRHYQAWRDGKTDKRSHPLFVCLDGPGTGKSRLLDEFPNVLQQRIFRDETQGDPAMKQLLQTAYNFKITFENGTTDNYGISDPRKMIGTRMLYQLQESDWTMFNANPVNQVFPAEVLTKLSAITETDSNRMCVILCVDSLQKLQHEPGSKHSEFYTAFASLCDLVNASKCWLIVICAATISQPVDEFLAASPQWREMLQTTSLKRPKIDGRDVFDTFDYGNGALTQLLVDDMGGHGRALEELFNVMLQNQGQAFEFIPVMHNVLAAIRQAYPAIVAPMQSMKQAFLAVISRRRVDGNSLFGNLTLDQVISCGLIRLDGTQLQCPFILYMLLETHDIPWSKHATYAPAERLEDLKPWQLWEHFNCKFRVLKSQAFAQEEPVLWTDIHHGARFGDGCNRRVIERQLTYALADKRMPTKTKGFKKGRCSCGNDQGKCFLYQPADGSPSGDAFLCLEGATKGFFHEVHQCKCVEGNLSLDVFEQERLKAAGPDDLFILYCTSLVTADLCLLPNSAFVDATCWEAYYGPFAARAFFIKSVPLPCINTSSEVQLEFVEGVGPAYRARIAKKRPFTSLEDAFVKTKIPVKVLRRFKFNTDSR